MGKTFAPTREHTPEGWVIYPSDVQYRKVYFIPESFQHPAKMVCFMLEDIVDYVSEPGETILDPMAGTGTLMLAALKGRKVVLLEDSSLYHMFQQMSADLFAQRGVSPAHITCLHGPCQDYLPMPCDHVIFSPPYSSVLKFKVRHESTAALGGSTYTEGGAQYFDEYLGESAKNLGRFQPFQYNMEMSRIYGLLLKSVRPGGTMTVVVQDVMRGGEREPITDWVMRTCVKQGWVLKDWFDRYTTGTGYKKSMKAKGFKVVENESIIILERPNA